MGKLEKRKATIVTILHIMSDFTRISAYPLYYRVKSKEVKSNGATILE